MAELAQKIGSLKLGNATLPELSEHVLKPTYDRSSLTPGIVHIGVGNFHRAHQAWYLHRLMQMGKAHDWAILGAGVRQADMHMREKLLAQDCLTTLIELDPSGRSAEVSGSMIDFIPVEPDNASLIAALSNASIRIVSLTVTEGGYYRDAQSGGLDKNHPDIVHDVENPATPKTAFGAIVAALKNRRENGERPFTCMSCDNLQGNGAVLKEVVVSLARLTDPHLADWISEMGAFPNSMVDCIVPATGPDELALANEFGIDDQAPVTHENFRQWVIEDHFCNGRPEWEHVGATLTQDVHDYESMKIRILNAGHQVLANAGELLGLETIADCMVHPTLEAFFLKVQKEEIAAHVAAVPELTAAGYVDLVVGRFSNPSILDTTRRVAFDGSSRHPGFVLPIVQDALKAGTSIDGLALVEALWARMCAGRRENGSVIEPNDPQWDTLNAMAIRAKSNPQFWLEQTPIYGNLVENNRFCEAFAKWLNILWTDGAEAALNKYLAG